MVQAFKIKLAAIAKDEGFYLPLWVYHHLRFGFDVLDIRVNDTTDNSWQVLEKLKTIYGARLRFSFADQEMEECRAKDLNFQAYIYKKIYEETLQEDFTHLIFLDIDEYWCSANFTETIKDFLAKVPDFDVCMFQWLMEVPNEKRSINDFALQAEIVGQKSDHVKSLMNLNARILAIRIHNYVLKSGQYILPDKTAIKFLDDDRSRGILPDTIFEKSRLVLEDYFIYHQVFRSQEEYIAGLLRGNKQNGDDSILKTNRFGYLATKPEIFNINWSIDQQFLEDYRIDYLAMITALDQDLEKAKGFVLDRKDKVVNLLSSDSFMQQIHENKMRGISKDIYQRSPMKHVFKAKISQINFDEKSLVCHFNCEVTSDKENYELLITQGFNQSKVSANINLLNEQELKKGIIKVFYIEIKIAELLYIIYSRQPPFCLVAKIEEELVVLERMKFRSIAPVLALHAESLRKQALQLPASENIQPKTSKFNSRLWSRLFKRPK